MSLPDPNDSTPNSELPEPLKRPYPEMTPVARNGQKSERTTEYRSRTKLARNGGKVPFSSGRNK